MKDDSLSDVSFYNTKEGMHIRATELGIKAYNLGYSCSDCNKGFDQMIDSLSDVDRKKIAAYHKSVIDGATVKGGVFSDSVDRALEVAKANGATVHPRVAEIKRAIELGDSVGKQENVYSKQIWNDAIDAAAKELDIIKDLGGAFLVRKLKK